MNIKYLCDKENVFWRHSQFPHHLQHEAQHFGPTYQVAAVVATTHGEHFRMCRSSDAISAKSSSLTHCLSSLSTTSLHQHVGGKSFSRSHMVTHQFESETVEHLLDTRSERSPKWTQPRQQRAKTSESVSNALVKTNFWAAFLSCFSLDVHRV